MTVRAVAGTADGKTTHHADTAASLPAGRDFLFVFDDTKTYTLSTVLNMVSSQLQSSKNFKGA